jgi:hypothetical protein
MKHAVERDLDAMIYIPSFMKTGSVIQKVTRRMHRNTDSMMIA